MVKVIKTDKKNHYFINKVTGEYVDRYDPDLKDIALVTKMDDGSVLRVDKKEIKADIGNQLHFQYGPDKYIIDDGYQNRLIRAGYLILNNFDKEQVLDKNKGVEVRKKMVDYVKKVINDSFCEKQSNVSLEVFNGNEMVVKYRINGFLYIICIDTINGIVNKNQQRKFYELPFYPFLKEMDKYGTMYISVFCKKEEDFEEMDFDRYDAGEKFLISIINSLNQDTEDSYKFTRVIVKRRINYSQGI